MTSLSTQISIIQVFWDEMPGVDPIILVSSLVIVSVAYVKERKKERKRCVDKIRPGGWRGVYTRQLPLHLALWLKTALLSHPGA